MSTLRKWTEDEEEENPNSLHRKNVSSNTSDNTIRTRKSKWRRILDILFE